ncbi:MAG: hypothetical protein ACXAC2_03675, partial [Candidatus Kariarchaeaceae archaeon]
MKTLNELIGWFYSHIDGIMNDHGEKGMDISVDIDKDYRLAVWDNEEKICASFHYRDLDKHDGES